MEKETESERAYKRKKFEKYIYEHRPYLNPDLRITDLMQAFHTNRTYISRFINREYGMNFSRYINMLRLREMEALRNDLTLLPPSRRGTRLPGRIQQFSQLSTCKEDGGEGK
ncbi:hypothetical protein NXW38_25100 [Bacteroides ovatus]|nr:hypothetical protein [Bacteroides ovatus]